VGDTAEPIPADDKILIDVHAASERRPGHAAVGSAAKAQAARHRFRIEGTETMLTGITS
jgi:hypothetical protein